MPTDMGSVPKGSGVPGPPTGPLYFCEVPGGTKRHKRDTKRLIRDTKRLISDTTTTQNNSQVKQTRHKIGTKAVHAQLHQTLPSSSGLLNPNP